LRLHPRRRLSAPHKGKRDHQSRDDAGSHRIWIVFRRRESMEQDGGLRGR
jgi:hypothetical protein